MSNEHTKSMAKPLPIDDNQYIYRFVSFYELYQIFKKKMLKLSLLAVQEDLNEGVGATLRFATPEWAGFYTDANKVSKQHSYTAHNTYITCWTMAPDSVAMWLLYSHNKESLRIRSTAGKLKFALAAYYEANCWTNHLHYNDGSELLTWHWEIKPVDYSNLDSLVAEINDVYAQFRNSCRESAAGNPEWWTDKERFLKRFPKFIDELRDQFDLGHFVKDSGFAYEKELRGVMHAGVRNSLDVDVWRNLDDPMRTLFKSAEPGILPNFIYANIDDDFVDEICFDPRMPEYQRQVVRDALSPLGVQEAETRCFNSLVGRGLLFDPLEGIRRDVNAQHTQDDVANRRG